MDSPGVNEPEQHLSVRDLVTEDLSLDPPPLPWRAAEQAVAKVNRFEDIAELWIEQLPADRRLELLTALALADPATDLLVVDSPDRHSANPATGCPRLEAVGVRRRAAARRRRGRRCPPGELGRPGRGDRQLGARRAPDRNRARRPTPRSRTGKRTIQKNANPRTRKGLQSDCSAAGPLRTQAHDRRASAQADHPGADHGAAALRRRVPLRELGPLRQPQPHRRRAGRRRLGCHVSERHPNCRRARRWPTAWWRATFSTGSRCPARPRPMPASVPANMPSP